MLDNNSRAPGEELLGINPISRFRTFEEFEFPRLKVNN